MSARPACTPPPASGMPFTNSTMSGMMNCFTQPGVSMRNWLMAWNWLLAGLAKSISFTTGSCSPVNSFASTCALNSNDWIASFASSSVRFGWRKIWSRSSSSCRSLSQVVPSSVVLMARTALRNTSGNNHSRKLPRRLTAGSAGMNPWPWSMAVQPSATSWSRKGFSTWRNSLMPNLRHLLAFADPCWSSGISGGGCLACRRWCTR